MPYFIDQNNYITGWVSDSGGDERPWPEMCLIGALHDEYRNPKYKLTNGKISLELQDPSDSQLETKRKRDVVQGIRERCSLDDEISLINKAIVALMAEEPVPEEYINYRLEVEAIKAAEAVKIDGIRAEIAARTAVIVEEEPDAP